MPLPLLVTRGPRRLVGTIADAFVHLVSDGSVGVIRRRIYENGVRG